MAFGFDAFEGLGNQVSVTIPPDENGYIGRECPQPACEGYFKVKLGTGLPGVETRHCPYCGHTDSSGKFFTKAQVEYAKSVVLGQVVDAIRRDLKRLEFDHKPQGAFGIGLSMKVKDGPPVPIRYYREESLETEVKCDSCALEYSVFGVFAYCPDCRIHNSLQILERNLELVRRQLTLAATQDAELQRHLVEDALENCVSAFDGFGRECCRVCAAASTDPGKAESLSFQNLRRVAERLNKLFGLDLASTVSPQVWARADILFQRRHLISHKSGVIDAQYLTETGDPQSMLGRRVQVEPADVIELASVLKSLGSGLLSLLPRT
jgi:hypothetical protein